MNSAAIISIYDEVHIGTFTTESGISIPDVVISYERAGPTHGPIIFVCHALTGNQCSIGLNDSPGWWSGLIGEGKNIDTSRWQVITMNVLGGCSGSTGPQSMIHENQQYKARFPFVTVRDIVHSHYLALKKLGIHQVHAIIGGSLGGMQVLEWGIMYPDFAKMLFPLATSPYLSDYGIAYNTISRFAITNDPSWNDGEYDTNPNVGLSIARMVGMISYRSREQFNNKFSREAREGWGNHHEEKAFQIESYLHYQGEKFVNRFDANSYLYLLKAMDSHDIGRGRGGWLRALESISAKVVAISYKGDLIYPSETLEQLVEALKDKNPTSKHIEVDTSFGHDGFLVEYEKWGHLIEEELNENH
ncbi:homoserine O-acetyltransferase MetX [Bacillus suaedaesalsae]|uniref:homoserine O-acetyltransferase MetX n=1 Tax=Bacillus suaedaesalsae TaxID=2810349 RepID=UPI00321196A1